ncbi:putative leader peptide [Petropleomorpha daqingensis]
MDRTVLASRRHVDLLRTASAQCRSSRCPRRARRPALELRPCPTPPVPV